jgi:hypothetical protein
MSKTAATATARSKTGATATANEPAVHYAESPLLVTPCEKHSSDAIHETKCVALAPNHAPLITATAVTDFGDGNAANAVGECVLHRNCCL